MATYSHERYSVRKDFSLIRASGVVGTCPQFDTLYNELTAQEHVALLSEFQSAEPSESAARRPVERTFALSLVFSCHTLGLCTRCTQRQ